MNKFKLERKSIEAAKKRRMLDRLLLKIHRYSQQATLRPVKFVDDLVSESFIYGGTATVADSSEWTGPGYWANIDDLPKVDYTHVRMLSRGLPVSTINNGDGTYKHTISFGAMGA
jgi:hypothetical protein